MFVVWRDGNGAYIGSIKHIDIFFSSYKERWR